MECNNKFTKWYQKGIKWKQEKSIIKDAIVNGLAPHITGKTLKKLTGLKITKIFLGSYKKELFTINLKSSITNKLFKRLHLVKRERRKIKIVNNKILLHLILNKNLYYLHINSFHQHLYFYVLRIYTWGNFSKFSCFR